MTKRMWIALIIILLLVISIVCFIFLFLNKIPLGTYTSIELMLDKLNITDCEITEIGNYYLEYNNPRVTVTDEDMNSYINRFLNLYPIYEEKEKNIIELGDGIYVSYKLFLDDTIVHSIEDIYFSVGLGKFNYDIELDLIGKSRGSYQCEVSGIDLMNLQLSSLEEYDLELVIHSIGTVYVPVLDDGFVREHTDYESVEDYREAIRSAILNQKTMDQARSIKRKLMDTLIETSNFSLSKESIAQDSISFIDTYETEAYLHGYDLSEYIKEVLLMSENEFYEFCYKKGEREIKEYLIIAHIAQKEGLVVSKEERLAYLGIDDMSDNQMENAEDMCYVDYKILQDKVYELLFDKGINIAKDNDL